MRVLPPLISHAALLSEHTHEEAHRAHDSGEEYVTFVRIVTLMCRCESISAVTAAIFVTLNRGASLDHQGHPLRQRAAAREPGGFASRLRSVIDSHGGTSALARIIARSEGAVRKWLRAESEPNVTDLRAICDATATSVAWLVSGDGERTPSTVHARRAAALADDVLLETLLEQVDAELVKGHLQLASTQRSALIVTLYQLFRDQQAIDPEALARLVRLARA
jgi:transcriptional regulator with XRE-family HTH domain